MSMLLSSLRLAVRAILANKMRSFLTMLGVIIGVTSMVALVSIGQGRDGFRRRRHLVHGRGAADRIRDG